MIIKQVFSEDVDAAYKVVLDVFNDFLFSEDGKKGTDTFIMNVINNENGINRYKKGIDKLYCAFENDMIVGVLGLVRKNHFNLCFVRGDYQRKGIGTALIDYLVKDNSDVDCFTLNSSIHGYDFYLHYGFIPTDSLKNDSGINFIPMVYYLNK